MSWVLRTLFGSREAEPAPAPVVAVEDEEEAITTEFLCQATGKLYRLDATTQRYTRAADQVSLAVRADVDEKHNFHLELFTSSNTLVLSQPVNHKMQLSYNKTDQSMLWMLVSATNSNHRRTVVWKFVFNSSEEEGACKMTLAKCLLETDQQKDYQKLVKKGDDQYILDAYDDRMDTTEDGDGQDESPGFTQTPRATRSKAIIPFATPQPDYDTYDDPVTSEDDSDYDYEEDNKSSNSGYDNGIRLRMENSAQKKKKREARGFNTLLEVGMTSDRAFVFREEGEKTMMGVFKYDNSNEGKMSFVTKLDSVTDRAGENIVPTTTMLHQQDSQLLMLDAKKPDKVFQMDLETGKVVEEWKASEYFDISSIAPTQKYSQLEQESTILAANQNMLFRLDPRLSGNKLVESEKLVYKTNPGMTCIATNGAGQIVSGDKRGDLRLYSHANKRAKTRLPSLGNGIIGVDVTEDGKWVLATAKNYLLVIPTEVPNDSKQRTGFQVGMSAAKKPKPIKLTLHPTDLVTYNIKKIDFTPAHFNMSSTGSEKWIVTSTGKYIITFNFSRVVAGKQFAYKIKKCNDKIVSDNFRYGLDNEVVVVEPHNLYVEERRGGR